MKKVIFCFTILISANAFAGGAYCQRYEAALLNGQKAVVATYQVVHSLADDSVEEFAQIRAPGKKLKTCIQFAEISQMTRQISVCGIKLRVTKVLMDENCTSVGI